MSTKQIAKLAIWWFTYSEHDSAPITDSTCRFRYSGKPQSNIEQTGPPHHHGRCKALPDARKTHSQSRKKAGTTTTADR